MDKMKGSFRSLGKVREKNYIRQGTTLSRDQSSDPIPDFYTDPKIDPQTRPTSVIYIYIYIDPGMAPGVGLGRQSYASPRLLVSGR